MKNNKKKITDIIISINLPNNNYLYNDNHYQKFQL